MKILIKKTSDTMEEMLDNMVTPSDWVPVDSIIKVIGVGGGLLV